MKKSDIRIGGPDLLNSENNSTIRSFASWAKRQIITVFGTYLYPDCKMWLAIKNTFIDISRAIANLADDSMDGDW